jgi:hypothetical protein
MKDKKCPVCHANPCKCKDHKDSDHKNMKMEEHTCKSC